MTLALDPRPPLSGRARRAEAQAERYWRDGVAHAAARRWAEAERAFARAVRQAPADALYLTNLANARLRLDDLRGAREATERSLALDPDQPVAIRLRRTILLHSNRFEDALEDARRLAEAPEATEAEWFDYGNALLHANRPKEAIEALLRCLKCKIDHGDAYILLASAFVAMKMQSEAVECLRTAALLSPSARHQALSGVVFHSLHAADWRQLREDLAAIDTAFDAPGPVDFKPFMLLAVDPDAMRQRRAFTDYVTTHYGAIPELPQRAPTAGDTSRPIRIGYLSNDFHAHATASLLVNVLERHDRSRFHVSLYSYGVDDGSALRRRLEHSSNAFVDIARLSDQEAAERIRADGIDILVELKGYTLRSRLGICARRPAPIQVAWLGFPGTMGAPFIDYAIVDGHVAPPGSEGEFTEKLARMPGCYQPNDPLREVAQTPSRAACGLPEGAFVFCCFNQTYKIWPQVFDIWCRLLNATPGSVLWLLESEPQAREHLLREAASRGVGADRIVFAPFVKYGENIARLVHADLCLDTLPVNSHTTASDALWAGVPLLTCTGNAFAGRVAASLLHAVGLPELVVHDLQAYEALALRLASDASLLGELRSRLARNRESAPLFDSARTTRELEALYVRMFERWRGGLSPDHLPAIAADPDRR
jgi:protein O-GlcNAc transferase